MVIWKFHLADSILCVFVFLPYGVLDVNMGDMH